MRILIFGATGMLGQALQREAKARAIETIGVARSGTDICLDIRDENLVSAVISRVKPAIVINAAAITSLAECEKNPGYAYQINSRPAGLIAELCRKNGLYFIQISTDHYYAGDGDAKHKETHNVYLLNEYARTKYAAEMFALTYERSLVVRTNIVGFRGKPNQPTFVEWAIQTLKDQAPITLFNDFYTSSIDVLQFSEALFEVIDKQPVGILNLASRDVANKETFIKKIATKIGYSLAYAKIGSVNDDNIVVRADSLGLDVAKAEVIIGRPLPTLDGVIDHLITEYSEGITE